LTRYNYPGSARIDITTANQVFRGMEIFGDIRIMARGTRFYDCLFRGPNYWPTNDAAIVECNFAAGYDTQFADCTFEPQLPNYRRNALVGHEFKAFRCHIRWCNDSIGIFTAPALGAKPTNVEISACLLDGTVYWHGKTAQYAGQPTGNITVRGPQGQSYTVPPWVQSDGTHNDGIQIQGAYGGTKSVWVHGNAIYNYDWDQVAVHPDGAQYPVPMLGSQDTPHRHATRLFDGHVASNGQAIIAQQNVNQFPQSDTVVIENNHLDSSGQLFVPAAGAYPAVQMTFRNNTLGPNAYVWTPTNPKPLMMRVGVRLKTTLQGSAAGTGRGGAETNRFRDPTNHWRPDGTLIAEGRTAGIYYDA